MDGGIDLGGRVGSAADVVGGAVVTAGVNIVEGIFSLDPFQAGYGFNQILSWPATIPAGAAYALMGFNVDIAVLSGDVFADGGGPKPGGPTTGGSGSGGGGKPGQDPSEEDPCFSVYAVLIHGRDVYPSWGVNLPGEVIMAGDNRSPMRDMLLVDTPNGKIGIPAHEAGHTRWSLYLTGPGYLCVGLWEIMTNGGATPFLDGDANASPGQINRLNR